MRSFKGAYWVIVLITDYFRPSVYTTDGRFVEIQVVEDHKIRRFETEGRACSVGENLFGDISLFEYCQEKDLGKYLEGKYVKRNI